METIVFLCNGDAEYYIEKGIIKNRELPNLIKSVISSGDYYKTSWSCGNSKFIQVGDRAYLQRSGNIGNQPSGFIAAGYVIAAPEDEQLRLLDSKYSDLSAAYISDYDRYFAVNIQIDSVVDFDFPLEQKFLKNLPIFQGINFNFGGSGCRFNSKSTSFLDSEWEKHSLIQQRQGRGRRLVDIFFEQGEYFKQNKDYQAAIDAYKLALKVDSKYSKAINRIKNCESIIGRESKNYKSPEPTFKPTYPELSQEKNELLLAREELDKENFFSVRSDADARQKITVSIARRQGQSKFRQSLLDAYYCKCAITNFDAEAALEAAHIIPYIETENNHPSNGLLLRADLHTLFDLNLIVIHPETMKVYIAPTLHKTQYRGINGIELRIPKNEVFRPKKQYLKQRFEQCKWFQSM
ncbi:MULTISPECIES: HNH endonuclease [Calothrix]|uniref:HNH endonuclease n=2 Tax=Calothrix TaxID=1186 RepID=A0ABR8A814_9CYAN|nr:MULTISPECIES: HNH endonuclease [Calothrix]MBD2195989.1 HNH endonuclease [Calothrix parietina FACHB-288]MBD2224521.1 HNH endonuclease [Calothrix anomala FACHB-343]